MRENIEAAELVSHGGRRKIILLLHSSSQKSRSQQRNSQRKAQESRRKEEMQREGRRWVNHQSLSSYPIVNAWRLSREGERRHSSDN
jgi:hypothetical protein